MQAVCVAAPRAGSREWRAGSPGIHQHVQPICQCIARAVVNAAWEVGKQAVNNSLKEHARKTGREAILAV